jgi:hypothetical protein
MRALFVATIVLGVTGCATLQAGDTYGIGQMLAAAGFAAQPADTEAKLAHLHSLAPRTLLRRDENGETYYLYADPSGCKCLYAGRQAEYKRYRELARQRTIADEAKIVNEDADDFRLWGLGPWP